jgi:hypothetical protein
VAITASTFLKVKTGIMQTMFSKRQSLPQFCGHNNWHVDVRILGVFLVKLWLDNSLIKAYQGTKSGNQYFFSRLYWNNKITILDELTQNHASFGIKEAFVWVTSSNIVICKQEMKRANEGQNVSTKCVYFLRKESSTT